MLITVYYITQIAVASIAIGGIILALVEFFSRKSRLMRILANNLKRDIAFITPDNSSLYNMESEMRDIKKSKIFKKDQIEHFSAYNNFGDVNNFGVIIIGYHSTIPHKDLENLIGKITANTPILIYTYGENRCIEYEKLNPIRKNFLVANFPLRLLGDIFSTMSIHKNI